MASKEVVFITKFPESNITDFPADDRKAKSCDLTIKLNTGRNRGISTANVDTEAFKVQGATIQDGKHVLKKYGKSQILNYMLNRAASFFYFKKQFF